MPRNTMTPEQADFERRARLEDGPVELCDWDEEDTRYWKEQRERCLRASQAQYPDAFPRF